MNRRIAPARRFGGSIVVPGDKSISHRALILAGLAEGTTTIRGLSTSEDVKATRDCLRRLGIKIRGDDERTLVVGEGLYGFARSPQPLFAGNSATTLRLLAGVLAAQGFSSVVTGDKSLLERPMERLAAPLRMMGARVELAAGGRAPVKIRGGPLRAIDYTLPVPSAQIKSAVLLAGLFARGTTTVRERLPSRNHTENMLSRFGARTARGHGSVSVRGGSPLRAADVSVPGDFSLAAPWIVAACLTPGSFLRVRRVMLNRTRVGLLRVLKKMGAAIRASASSAGAEPSGTIEARCSPLRGVDLDFREIPQLIDEIPLLALAATQARGVTRIRGAGELRYKESDRIAATEGLLRAMGAKLQVRGNDFIIEGPQVLRGAVIDPRRDHRIIMTAAIAGLLAQGTTRIRDSHLVAVSYPEFFRHLAQLTGP